MKVDDIVIVANLGEMKVYKATPRDLEAEAGLKEDYIKLDLINDVDFIEAHKRLKDMVSDMSGRFKSDAAKDGAGTPQANGLIQEIEDELIELLSSEIMETIKENNPPKYFLSIPETIFKRVTENIFKDHIVKEKLFRFVREDLVKVDKTKLPQIFRDRGEHF